MSPYEEPNANSRQDSAHRRSFGAMGRAAGRQDAVSRPTGRWQTDEPSFLVEQRVARLVGVSVVDHGVLAEPYGGHPLGTTYVVIRADCELERELARRELAELAGVPDLAWEHGWRARRLRNGDVVTELRIFPGARRSSASASS